MATGIRDKVAILGIIHSCDAREIVISHLIPDVARDLGQPLGGDDGAPVPVTTGDRPLTWRFWIRNAPSSMPSWKLQQ